MREPVFSQSAEIAPAGLAPAEQPPASAVAAVRPDGRRDVVILAPLLHLRPDQPGTGS